MEWQTGCRIHHDPAPRNFLRHCVRTACSQNSKDKNRSVGFTVARAFVTPRDKNRSLGFSPGNLRTTPPQKHCVFQPEEIRLTLRADFCPPSIPEAEDKR